MKRLVVFVVLASCTQPAREPAPSPSPTAVEPFRIEFLSDAADVVFSDQSGARIGVMNAACELVPEPGRTDDELRGGLRQLAERVTPKPPSIACVTTAGRLVAFPID